jgi:hypothetical protein
VFGQRATTVAKDVGRRDGRSLCVGSVDGFCCFGRGFRNPSMDTLARVDPKMQFRLRTLLIVLAVGPVVLAGAWFGWQRYLEYLEYKRQPEFDELIDLISTTIVPESTWEDTPPSRLP